MWKLKKKKKRDRQVNKFKNYNHTIVLCLFCVPFWNTAECEEVSHFNQLLQWKRVCSRMDRLQVSYKEVPKSFQSVIHLCRKKKVPRWLLQVTHKSKGHFVFSWADHWDGTLSLNSEGKDTVSRFSSLGFASRVCFTVEFILHQVRL